MPSSFNSHTTPKFCYLFSSFSSWQRFQLFLQYILTIIFCKLHSILQIFNHTCPYFSFSLFFFFIKLHVVPQGACLNIVGLPYFYLVSNPTEYKNVLNIYLITLKAQIYRLYRLFHSDTYTYNLSYYL